MKNDLVLIITSLISIVFSTFHFTSYALRAHPGNPEAGRSTLLGVWQLLQSNRDPSRQGSTQDDDVKCPYCSSAIDARC